MGSLVIFSAQGQETYDTWSTACPGCVNVKRIVGYNIPKTAIRTENIQLCLDRCDEFDQCASIEYNTKQMCNMNTRVLDATDTENKEGWVYCPKRADPDADPRSAGCLNGGSCKEGGCVCPEGTSGKNCEVVDPCVPNPCQNGGTCSEGDCTCPEGFEGDFCETEVIDPCKPNPCENGGTCVDGDCICPDGFEGVDCETKTVDLCDPSPCENGGTCIAGACTCPEGYSGANCEVSPAKKCRIKNCSKCNKRGKRCKKCNKGFRKSNKRKRCLKKGEKDPDCPSGNCPITIVDENENGIDDDEEESDRVCKIKGCRKCNKRGRRCKVCKKGRRRSWRRRRCLKKNEKDPDCPSGDCGDFIVDENNNGIDDDEEEDAADAAAGNGGNKKCKIPRCKKMF